MNQVLPNYKYDGLSKSSLYLIGICGLYVGWQLTNGWIKPYLSDRPFYFWISDILFSCLLPFILYKLSQHRNLHFSINSISFQNTFKIIGWMVIGLIIAFAALILMELHPISGWMNPLMPFSYLAMLPNIKENSLLFFAGKTYFALSAAIFEEWVYRHYLNERLAEWVVSWGVRTLLLSTLFAAIHWEGGVYNLIFAFGIGVFFASVFRKTQKIWPIVAMHFIIDFGFLN